MGRRSELAGKLRMVGDMVSSYAGPAHSTRVAVLHMGRVGSTVLCKDLVGSHPEVFWDGELFRLPTPKVATDPLGLLERQILFAGNRIHGFEMKILQSQQLEGIGYTLDSFIRVLSELGYTHYVLLYRRNLLRQLISAEIARAASNYFIRDASKVKRRTVALPEVGPYAATHAATLLEHFAACDAAYTAARALLVDRPLLELVYEDDIESDPNVGYARFCRFLNIQPVAAAKPQRVRGNPYPVSEVVENFAAISTLLADTPHAWMLET